MSVAQICNREDRSFAIGFLEASFKYGFPNIRLTADQASRLRAHYEGDFGKAAEQYTAISNKSEVNDESRGTSEIIGIMLRVSPDHDFGDITEPFA